MWRPARCRWSTRYWLESWLVAVRFSSDARAELEQLERALDATRAGSGATALIAGPAGIGKTRLASELASEHEPRVRDPPRALDRPRRDGTALPAFRRGPACARAPLAGRGTAPGSQLSLFENTLDLLTERTATAPLMLVLEDLHWADVSTLDLVVFLAHNLHDRPILLLATYRPTSPRRPSAFGGLRTGFGAPARGRSRPRSPGARRAHSAARGSLRGSRADGLGQHDHGSLGGQPVLCRGTPRRRARR